MFLATPTFLTIKITNIIYLKTSRLMFVCLLNASIYVSWCQLNDEYLSFASLLLFALRFEVSLQNVVSTEH